MKSDDFSNGYLERKFQSRRKILGIAGAFALSLVNPSRNLSGKFVMIRSADAAWVQVAMLALSAISMFSKSSDGGLGAYLQNIKTLSEENIRLTRLVLVSLGNLQSEVDKLPGRMRDIFIEVKGYELKQETQKILDQISLMEINFKKNKKLSSAEKNTCEQILDKCADLAGARSAVYGRGGTAAACIAVVGSVEARAAWFLGRTADFRERISIAYLPWFDEIFKDQDGSLQRIFQQEGSTLLAVGGTTLDSLPDDIKSALTKSWISTIASDPNSSSGDVVVSCGSYSRHTGNRRGECRNLECMGNSFVGIDNPTLQKILKSNELSKDSVSPLSEKMKKQIGVELRGRDHCFCTDWQIISNYTDETTADLHISLQNTVMDGVPQISLKTSWAANVSKSCPVFISGEAGAQSDQFLAARNSAPAIALDKQIQSFLSGPLNIYNDQRAIVFAAYLLLDAARSAREQFRQVIK